MLEFARGLTDRQLRAVAELEMRVVGADGGRLKLEWGVLRSRPGKYVEDFLWWEGDALVGFLGLYAFGAPTVEITGMVDPSERRRGIATALLDAALPVCRERRYRRALLVTPRGSPAVQALATNRKAELEHSEHALLLTDVPTDGPTDARITVRRAAQADAAELSRLLSTAFGDAPTGLLDLLEGESERTLLVEREGSAVGTLRLTRDRDNARIYGFAVDPAWQGRGIGRDVLRRVCRELQAEGAREVGLEVAVDNDHALGLYTSLGFRQITTEDYYALPLGWSPEDGQLEPR